MKGDQGAITTVRRCAFLDGNTPERERFSAFREEFVRRVLAMDVIDHRGGCPRADLTYIVARPG
jgi:hypothetical protein